MEIPYTVRPRPDTGLANPKLGIWLFLASEVMLFGGLFAGYIFMRLGAEPWMWPQGWLNVPVGTFNTFILIASSVTIILSWECLKMRNYRWYKIWLATTWICGLLFLTVKLAYEWPDKFHHFGAYVQKDALHKYEALLGNEDQKDKDGKAVTKTDEDGKKVPVQGRLSRQMSERRFISGHLPEENKDAMKLASIPYIPAAKLDNMIAVVWSAEASIPENEGKLTKAKEALANAKTADERKKAEEDVRRLETQLSITKRSLVSLRKILPNYGMTDADMANLLDKAKPETEQKKLRGEFLKKVNTIHVHAVDAYNADPYDPGNDTAQFIPRPQKPISELKDRLQPAGLVHEEVVTKDGKEEKHYHVALDKQDLVAGHGAFVPKLNTYLACYFMITGLHGAHVLGGCLVFIYFWLNIKGGSKLYHTNHQQLCNRIEVAGLFWHLVDLVWIFVFPIFYLL